MAMADDDTSTMAGNAMQVRDLYPLITTRALFEARDFYVTHFGFAVTFEATWLIYLTGLIA